MPAFQEPFPEAIQAQAILVLHPGSRFLRLGRASDLNPHTVLHAIARRKTGDGTCHVDPVLVPTVPLAKEKLQEVEEARIQISHTLQSCLRSDGSRRYATPPQQVAAFNRRSQPEKLDANKAEKYLEPTGDIIIGDDVLRLHPLENFHIHFPIRRGDLHLHKDVGGSLTAVLADLEAIWGHCIQTILEIPLKDLRHYRAVLIVPVVYNRTFLRELTALLLNQLGFGGCFLIQDHVAATFGAGLGFACVLDIGDQKTSVSCVEDGISHPSTRLAIEYGGSDITQSLHWLLQKSALPAPCRPEKFPSHAELLRQLKESMCHVNLDMCGPREHSFVFEQLDGPSLKYNIQMGDEAIIAPLGVFQPELFHLTGAKTLKVQVVNQGDPEDPHDEIFLRETSRRGAKEAAEGTAETSVGELCTPIGADGEEELVVEVASGTGSGMGGGGSEGMGTRELPPDQLLSLDQAVLCSIERCPTDELKRKMYSCVLVVGGGLKFSGIGTWLQNRLTLQVPFAYRSEQLELITSPKEIGPEITAWKGAAIMSCLESAQELWIRPREWSRLGTRILREKAPFLW